MASNPIQLSVVVPHIRGILESRDSFDDPEFFRAGQKQMFVPTEPVNEKLSIPHGSRLLFVAGCFGDWAHRLAQDAYVTYSDISRRMTGYARKRFKGRGIERFITGDAVRWPASTRYDYVVSYEPFDLEERLPLIGLRAMAYAKGIRIIFPTLSQWQNERIFTGRRLFPESYPHVTDPRHPLHVLAQYDASARVENLSFVGERLSRPGKPGKTGPRVHAVFMANSSEKACKNAKLDLALMLLLRYRASLSRLREHLSARGFTVSPKELLESLHRIDKIGKAVRRCGSARYETIDTGFPLCTECIIRE